MPGPKESPLHDFPDRSIREQLKNPRNLGDLLGAVVPDLAPNFDCDRAVNLKREFPLDDWHSRESDLVFLVPYRTGKGTQPVLVFVLIEHQSEPDPRMPLRTLLYTMLYWEREWRAWEVKKPPRPAFRLSPVLPIVFHTGPTVWRTNRSLAELLAGPERLHVFAPAWQPLFWDLAAQTPEALVNATAEWLQALAVVRVQDAEFTKFREVMETVLHRVEGLSRSDPVRWHELIRFILAWALHRRPGEERDELIDVAQASHREATRRKEIQKMGKTIAEVLYEEGEAKGETKGMLKAYREMLRALLEQRFSRLPKALVRRINTTADLEKLKAAVSQVAQMDALEDLDL